MGIILGRLKIILCVFCLSAVPVWGDGHGPAFGYSTATLGLGDTSVETSLMWRSGAIMFGPRITYGLKENLQISFSSPFHLNHGEHPSGRSTAMMPGDPEAEVVLGWRFYHASTGIGTRNEATLYAGGSTLTQEPPRVDGLPLRRQPGIYVAAAAGHVSRKYDVWAGAGYQRYGQWSSGVADHDSNTLLTSFVAGWRPSLFDMDYPKPDLRFFWETTGELVGQALRDETSPVATGSGGGHDHGSAPPPPPPSTGGIVVLPNSGGTGVFSGPTVLCTYHSMAFQGGVLFALWDRPNGTQPHEKFRAVIGVSYYFLGGRRK
jgi:hypothetical protein